MKKILAITLALVLALGMAVCASAEGLSVDKLVMTYVTSPLNIPSIIDQNDHVFETVLGVPVEYPEISSGADQTLALASGDVQLLYAVGGTSIILSAANGADIKVLNMYSRAPKAFCLYAKDETLTTPESLKGKTIAGPAGTNLHELLAAYLAGAGMSMDDVNFVSMSIPDSKAALDGGSADVAMLGGAAAYNAEAQGYHLVTDGEGLIKAIIAVATTEQYAKDHPGVIEKIEEAQKQIMEAMTTDEERAYSMAAETLGLDVEAVREMAACYDFSLDITEDDIAGFQKTADFLYESGMIDEPYDVHGLLLD